MKTSVKAAALLLPLFIAGSIFATPPSKQTYAIQSPPPKVKKSSPCRTCSWLAKESPPHAATIRGRVYDPNLRCHRELRFTPTATGKGSQFTSECLCS